MFSITKTALGPPISQQKTPHARGAEGARGEAKSSRRQKLRNKNQEGYAASLDKERKYMMKYRGKGSVYLFATVGHDVSDTNHVVAGGPSALVGNVN